MAMTEQYVDDVSGVEAAAREAAACLFHGFSDRSRLAIVQRLALGEHRVVDLTAHLGLAQSTVSAHLACLRDCGLVASRPQGRASMWSLTRKPELLGVLTAAERLLSATGDAVALCPPTARRPRHDVDQSGALTVAAAASAAARNCWPGHRSPTTCSRRSSRSPRVSPPRSVALVGFGLDSVVEVSSGLIVLWQFRHRLPETRERQALRLMAFAFFGLAAYVTVESVRSLSVPALPRRRRSASLLRSPR